MTSPDDCNTTGGKDSAPLGMGLRLTSQPPHPCTHRRHEPASGLIDTVVINNLR